jgi:hypothetical protein
MPRELRVVIDSETETATYVNVLDALVSFYAIPKS